MILFVIIINDSFIFILKKNRPFRGVGAVVAGAGPAHALYFATYEKSKERMSNLFPQYNHFNYRMYSNHKLEETKTKYFCF